MEDFDAVHGQGWHWRLVRQWSEAHEFLMFSRMIGIGTGGQAAGGTQASGALIGAALAMVISLLAVGCSSSTKESKETAGSSVAPPVVIQSHRGAGKLAPENTMQAFELAWRIGTIPEADVRTTKDGVPVAFHDNTFDRLVGNLTAGLRGKGTKDLTWAELSSLRIGTNGPPIPRIADVFEVMRGRPERLLYLDVKEVPLEHLAAMVSRFGVQSQVILASTDYAEIRRWAGLSPRSKTLLWMGGTEAKLADRMKTLRAAGFAGITQLQIHVKVGDLAATDPFQPSSTFLRAVADELKSRRILFQIFALTGCPTAGYERLMDLGVESFATDDPNEALQAASNHRQRSRP
jgi:glycerophosphoryl diester phosphodiesterase